MPPNKKEVNEALLIQQDGWRHVKRGAKSYYIKDRAIATASELHKILSRWARAATGQKWK